MENYENVVFAIFNRQHFLMTLQVLKLANSTKIYETRKI